MIVASAFFYGCHEDKPVAEAAPTRRARHRQSQLTRTTSVTIPQVGNVEPTVLFSGPMPTGVAVSHNGRIFVNFPRWGDPVEFTVGEVKRRQGRRRIPNAAINKLDASDQTDHADLRAERRGRPEGPPVDPRHRQHQHAARIKPGGPKLLCFDLKIEQDGEADRFQGDDVALPTTYLNDVRFDLNRGKEGMAFITDSSDSGPERHHRRRSRVSGESWRKLNDHPSTKADPNFVPNVEGEPLMARARAEPEAFMKIGSDGIAIDAKKTCSITARWRADASRA